MNDYGALLAFLKEQLLTQFRYQTTLTRSIHPGVLNTVNEANLIFYWVCNNQSTFSEYADAILQYCISEIDWKAMLDSENLFTNLAGRDADLLLRREKLSIKVQFFLAQINLYCYANKISTNNFGLFFDGSPFRQEIADLVYDSLEAGTVEEALFSFVNRNMGGLGMNRTLNRNDKIAISANFNGQFAAALDHDIYPAQGGVGGERDEFLVFMPGITGDFVERGNKLAVHLSDVVSDRPDLSPEAASHVAILRENRIEFKQHEGKSLPFTNDGVNREIVNAKSLAVKLCKLSDDNKYCFESSPEHAILSFQNEEFWTELKQAMKLILTDSPDALGKLRAFFIEPQLKNKAILEEKMKALTGTVPEALYADHDKLSTALMKVVDDYSRRASRWNQSPNRSGQIKTLLNIANDLKDGLFKYSEHEHQMRKTIIRLNKMIHDIDQEMGFFVRHSEFKDIVTATRDNLIRQLRELEARSGVIKQYEKVIMEKQTLIVGDQKSHLHELKLAWWNPKNRVYLDRLIALPNDLHSSEAVMFFNGIEPDQLSRTVVQQLKDNRPDFRGPIDIALRPARQAGNDHVGFFQPDKNARSSIIVERYKRKDTSAKDDDSLRIIPKDQSP